MIKGISLTEAENFIFVTVGITSIIVLALFCIVLIFLVVKTYIRRKVDIAIFADVPASMQADKIFINCVNLKWHQEFWDINEKKLSLYAMGMPMPVKFYRVPEIPNGYKIEFTEVLSNKQVLALTGAIKYNRFTMSNDGGETTARVNSIKDTEAKKITAKLQKSITKNEDYVVEEVIEKIKTSMKYSYIRNEIFDDGVIAHIDEDKATTTTLRYQVIIPEGHKLFDDGFAKENMRFFHSYNGKLYPLEAEFLNQVKDLYEYEIINLEPATIYAGLSVTIDGGKNIFPSSTLYGITREEDGGYPDAANAALGKPKSEKGVKPLWKITKNTSIKDKKIMKLTCDVLVKKHFEDEHPDDFLPISKVVFAYKYYDWIPFSLEELENEITEEVDKLEASKEIKKTTDK